LPEVDSDQRRDVRCRKAETGDGGGVRQPGIEIGKEVRTRRELSELVEWYSFNVFDTAATNFLVVQR
jgi:hypothetical protein